MGIGVFGKMFDPTSTLPLGREKRLIMETHQYKFPQLHGKGKRKTYLINIVLNRLVLCPENPGRRRGDLVEEEDFRTE